MQSTDLLKTEHRIIERVLHLLDLAGERIAAGEPLPAGFAAWAIDFIRQFADGCHHAKEEDMLFPRMEQMGIPRENGPIGCMLHEHEQGRECVRRMAASADTDPAAFAAAAKDYATLLRQHIFKEDNVLFRLAEQCLSSADDTAIMQSIAATEHAKSCPHVHKKYQDEADAWEAKLALQTVA